MSSIPLDEDEGFFSTKNIIIFVFLILLVVLISYLYFANKALLAGSHRTKKHNKSKKGKQYWSYGD